MWTNCILTHSQFNLFSFLLKLTPQLPFYSYFCPNTWIPHIITLLRGIILLCGQYDRSPVRTNLVKCCGIGGQVRLRTPDEDYISTNCDKGSKQHTKRADEVSLFTLQLLLRYIWHIEKKASYWLAACQQGSVEQVGVRV